MTHMVSINNDIRLLNWIITTTMNWVPDLQTCYSGLGFPTSVEWQLGCAQASIEIHGNCIGLLKGDADRC